MRVKDIYHIYDKGMSGKIIKGTDDYYVDMSYKRRSNSSLFQILHQNGLLDTVQSLSVGDEINFIDENMSNNKGVVIDAKG